MHTITTTPAAEAAAIRTRRLSLGLTQRQLAARAACSLTWVANIEAGCVPNRSDAIERIYAALDEVESQKAQRPSDDRGVAKKVIRGDRNEGYHQPQ